jgi:hypothetical protein
MTVKRLKNDSGVIDARFKIHRTTPERLHNALGTTYKQLPNNSEVTQKRIYNDSRETKKQLAND